jgi:hypothetical protein
MSQDEHPQTFTVASDERLVELIRSAKTRIVVVAPALTSAVAEAVASRCSDEALDITAILDADEEVYRLGYGDQATLETLRNAMTQSGLGLALQPGVRIGMIIADGQMLIYSPVPRLIEAGSDREAKPNAILIRDNAVERVAAAASGAGEGVLEIGKQGLGPDDVDEITKKLAAQPPQAFDIARAVRVFSSRAEFVELQVENVRMNSRRVALPPELLGIRDESLRGRVSGGVSAPEVSGPFDIEMEWEDGSTEITKVSSKWVSDQRAKIERDFTFVVPRHGRVILTRDKAAFQAAVERFERNCERYRVAVEAKLSEETAQFKQSLMNEYLPSWQASPPRQLTRFSPNPTHSDIEVYLSEVLDRLLKQAFVFEPVRCSVIFKGITYASTCDDAFITSLTGAMRKRGVPEREIERLFRAFDAAGSVETKRAPIGQAEPLT